MKRMSLTLAFLISILVILWFFGVTLFHFGPQALMGKTDSYIANVFMEGKFQSQIDGEDGPGAESVHKDDADDLCDKITGDNPLSTVRCFWRGNEMERGGFFGN